MKVLGVKVSSEEVRFALLEIDVAGNVVWLNQNTEHRLIFPRSALSRSDKVEFLFREFNTILGREHPATLVIKTTESGRGGYKQWALDYAGYEVAIILAANAHHVSVQEKRYAALRLNSTNVETFVLQHIVRLPALWTKHLVDALAVALRALGK